MFNGLIINILSFLWRILTLDKSNGTEKRNDGSTDYNRWSLRASTFNMDYKNIKPIFLTTHLLQSKNKVLCIVLTFTSTWHKFVTNGHIIVSICFDIGGELISNSPWICQTCRSNLKIIVMQLLCLLIIISLVGYMFMQGVRTSLPPPLFLDTKSS